MASGTTSSGILSLVSWGVNACARSYVDRGDKNYGDELYLLLDVDMSDVTIVDHYGDGSSIDGCRWYESQKTAEEVR